MKHGARFFCTERFDDAFGFFDAAGEFFLLFILRARDCRESRSLQQSIAWFCTARDTFAPLNNSSNFHRMLGVLLSSLCRTLIMEYRDIKYLLYFFISDFEKT